MQTNQMKQANITLQTAKALYAQGGAARQLALDNFSESDLTEPNWPPKRYEDLGYVEGCFIDGSSKNWISFSTSDAKNRNIAPTSADCESILAFCQLRQLAERMNEGWEPSIYDRGFTVNYHDKFNSLAAVKCFRVTRELIFFQTEEMAEFSLKHHKELWEKYWKV